jgi:hypothetical protein
MYTLNIKQKYKEFPHIKVGKYQPSLKFRKETDSTEVEI